MKIYTTEKNTQNPSINFFNDTLNKLDVEAQLSIEGKLNEYECPNALKQMNNSKSPGSDGITTEFYKLFWKDIKNIISVQLITHLKINN